MGSREELLEAEQEGQQFIGKDTTTPGYLDWYNNCKMLIQVLFDKEKAQCFHRSPTTGKLAILRSLADEIQRRHEIPSTVFTVTQTQISTIQQEMKLQVLLNIENSDLSSADKEEAKGVYEEVEEEVQSANTNWEKVKGLLKRSIDFGLKIAPDIIKLAETYYKAKGGI
jgi:hypothetical protein